MSDAELDDLPLLLAAFEMQLQQDRAGGGLRRLEDYQAEFPAAAAAIARLFPLLQQAAAPPPASAGPLPGPGSRIGSYRLLHELGRGGQGAVFLAEDTRVAGRRVALKLLDRLGLDAEVIAQRFAREAAVAARLDHPGICPVFDVGTWEGRPYLVMRYVEGVPLSQHIRAARAGDGPLARTAAARESFLLALVEAIARALHAAHVAGVVHRDVKPGNVMVTPAGAPVLLDFGLARDQSEDGATLTRTGDVLGTPAYMAPEQLGGGAVPDRRTDVWAVGVLLYECLTLELPFAAPTREGLYRAILVEAPPRPAAPRDLRVILATALSKTPDGRYASAVDLAEDLARVRRLEPIRARPPGMAVRLLRWVQRSPARAGLLGVALLALLIATGALGFLAARWPDLQRVAADTARVQRDQELQHAFFACWHGNAQLAEGVFARLLAAAPDCVEARAGLALAQVRTAGVPAALATLARAAEPELQRLRACLLAAGQGSRPASAPAAAAATALGAFVEGLVEMGTLQVARDSANEQRAARHFRRATLLSPAPGLLYSTLFAQAAGFAAAPDLVDEAVAVLATHWPGRADTQYWIGHALADVDATRAIAAWRRALALEPWHAPTVLALAPVLAKSGAVDEARALAQEFVARAPQEPQAHLALAKVLEVERRLADVEPVAARAAALAPNSWQAFLMLGSARLYTGHAATARAPLARALELAPWEPRVHTLLAALAQAEGELDVALWRYRRAVAGDPDFGATWWNLGSVLDQLGLRGEAATALTRCVELGQGQRWLPADAARVSGRAQRQARTLAAAAAGWPEDGPYGEAEDLEAAEALAAAGRWPAAVQAWQRVLAQPPALDGHSSLRLRAAAAALKAGGPWLATARDWMLAELDAWRAALAADRTAAPRLRDRSTAWREQLASADLMDPSWAKVRAAWDALDAELRR